jgi:hypothetical protein
MVMPPVPACGWAGLGSVGCSGSCNTWLVVGGLVLVLHDTVA